MQDKTAFTSDNKNVFLVEKKTIAAKDNYNLSIDRYRVNGNEKQSNFEMTTLGQIAKFIQGKQVDRELHLTEPQESFVRFIRIIDYTQVNKDISMFLTPGRNIYAIRKI